MKEKKLMDLSRLFFEYNALYHQKLDAIFREDDHQEPHCNKNQKKALFILDEKHRVTPSELGRFLDLQKATLTSLVDCLVEQGLVLREPDLLDRRKTWLALTEAGTEYIRVKKMLYDSDFARRFVSISEAEIDASLTSLKSLVGLMGKL